MTPPPRPSTGPLRWLLLGAGVLSTALAALGAVLPVLPTTPFLLLAGACFVRSSPKLHQRLLQNSAFGPYLAQWERDRTIPREAKRRAYFLAVASFGLSISIAEAAWLRWTLLGIGVVLLLFLRALPTTSEEPKS